MKVAVLTSTRADYSIYYPILKKMQADEYFDLEVIAFGTHISEKHGQTVDLIVNDGFNVSHKIDTLSENDDEYSVNHSMAKVIIELSNIWNTDNYDLVLSLGDRYEMYAAVASTISFNLKVGHIHGGETTIGAIDNKYRHAISACSDIHFVTTRDHQERVKSIIGEEQNVYYTGAPALDNLQDIKLLTKQEIIEKYGVDVDEPTILCTFHSETTAPEQNENHARSLLEAIELCGMQAIITMPNSDTNNDVIRKVMMDFSKDSNNVFTFESLGLIGYYSCMSHCAFMLGNTSSGIIEAASFGKYVIDVGERQKGRSHGNNVFHCSVSKLDILDMIEYVKGLHKFTDGNIYVRDNASDRIIEALKKYHQEAYD